MKSLIMSLALSCMMFTAFSQNDEVDEYDENYEFPESKSFNFNIGLGLGLDYGGIGGRLSFVPAKNIAIFGAIGYNFNGAGYNGGIIVRMAPDKKVCPFLIGMYGYNAVIVIEGRDEANKTYYGASFGGGIELHRRDKPNFWNFGLAFPVRSQEYRDAMDRLRNDPSIELTEPLPFTISVGYHFGL
jgi:hypothetical protein